MANFLNQAPSPFLFNTPTGNSVDTSIFISRVFLFLDVAPCTFII